MEENTEDGLFGSLKGLIWGAFVSVISFQLLAPQIWSYLHGLLGIGYHTAYWTFTATYFLFVPVMILLWALGKREILKRYLPPFNSGAELHSKSRIFLTGFLLFVGLQITIAIWGFFLHWTGIVIFAIWLIYLVCNGGLLYLCHGFSIECIHGSGLNHRNIARVTRVFLRAYFSSILIGSLLFFVAGLFLNNWNNNRQEMAGKPAVSSREAGLRGFRLQDMNENIQQEVAYIDSLEDVAAYDAEISNIAKIGKNATIRLKEENDTLLHVYYKNLLTWGENISAFDHSVTSLLAQLKNQDSLRQDIPLLLIDRPEILPHCLDKGGRKYLEVLKLNLSGTSRKLEKATQSLLGIQLRSVQAKGLLLLISLFFTVLSLHLYVRLINNIQILQLAERKEQALTEMPNPFLDAAREEDAETSGRISTNLWVFLTITAWLLIPIFKPVVDAEIDVKAPFVTATAAGDVKKVFNNYPGPDRGGTSTSSRTDSLILKEVHYDTVRMLTKDTLPIDLKDSLGEIHKTIKSVQQKVNIIEDGVTLK